MGRMEYFKYSSFSFLPSFFSIDIRQSQVVNHTNFRIDNIMSTTRFTELPEQAQKELDELEKYIRMESQRCEYIGKQKMPQHLDAMDNARKNTEILSQVRTWERVLYLCYK